MKPLGETPRCPVHDLSATWAYRKRGCRCETCTTYHRDYWREYQRKRRKEPEYLARRRDYQREYYRKRRKEPEYRAAHREQKLRSHLKRKYGITVDDYDRILEEQGGVCALCGGTSPNGQRLAVDHDHATGHVRELLCFACNTALHSRRRPEWYRKAAEYLERQTEELNLEVRD